MQLAWHESLRAFVDVQVLLAPRAGVGNYFCSGATLRPAFGGGSCLMRAEASLGL